MDSIEGAGGVRQLNGVRTKQGKQQGKETAKQQNKQNKPQTETFSSWLTLGGEQRTSKAHHRPQKWTPESSRSTAEGQCSRRRPLLLRVALLAGRSRLGYGGSNEVVTLPQLGFHS